MAHKTKAALQGRQCHYQKLKQGQNTRGNAGGQRMGAFAITGTAALAQFTYSVKHGQILRNSFRGMQTPDLADGYRIQVKSRCANLQLAKACSPLAHTPGFFRSFEVAKTGEVKFKGLRRKPVRNYAPRNGGAKGIGVFAKTGENSNRSPDIGYHPSSASLAFLRCRRFISPLIEATTKPAVLSPSSFNFSSSPINSNGTLETICCDFLFLEPVAISAFPSDWWHSVYAKRKHNQHLKVAFTLLYGKCMPPIMVKHKWQRPGVLGTTAEASNHNVSWSNDHG